MVVDNTVSEIGDILIIKTLPISGVDSFVSFTPIYIGQTVDRYFFITFKYAKDGIHFSDSKELTDLNLSNISLTYKDSIIFEFTLIRSGTDNTGLLEFNSIDLITLDNFIENGKDYNNSILKLAGNVDKDCSLAWSLNVLKKIYDKGLLANFVERNVNTNYDEDVDFIKFWKHVTDYFSYFVCLARYVSDFYGDINFIREFLRQRNLFLCDDLKYSDLYILMINYYNEIRKRGTLEVIKKRIISDDESDSNSESESLQRFFIKDETLTTIQLGVGCYDPNRDETIWGNYGAGYTTVYSGLNFQISILVGVYGFAVVYNPVLQRKYSLLGLNFQAFEVIDNSNVALGKKNASSGLNRGVVNTYNNINRAYFTMPTGTDDAAGSTGALSIWDVSITNETHIKDLPLPAGAGPTSIAVNPTNGFVYVVCSGLLNVQIIDPATDTIVGSFTPSVSLSVRNITFCHNGTDWEIYLDGNSVFVAIYDLSHLLITTLTSVSFSTSFDSAFNPNVNKLYIGHANANGGVSVIDTATRTVLGYLLNIGTVYGVLIDSSDKVYVSLPFTDVVDEFKLIELGEREPEIIISNEYEYNGELLRMICYDKDVDDFIFNFRKQNKIGWNIGNTSPLYRGMRPMNDCNKSYEDTQDIVNPQKYPLTNESDCDSYFDNDKKVFQIKKVTANQKTGFYFDPSSVSKIYIESFAITVEPTLDYEISFRLKTAYDTNSVIQFGLFCFDKDFNLLQTVNVETKASSNLFVEDLLLANQNYYYGINGIIYSKDKFQEYDPDLLYGPNAIVSESGTWYKAKRFVPVSTTPSISTDYWVVLTQSEINFALKNNYGTNLQFTNYICKIIPVIYSYSSSVTATIDARIWDIKIRPVKTLYSTGFIQTNNWIDIWLKNRNKKYSFEEINQNIRKYLLPYDCVFKITPVKNSDKESTIPFDQVGILNSVVQNIEDAIIITE